jgi:hypothetical protein
MKVFISWSGERSRELAEFLSGWLKKLPLTIEPWVSKDAIDPGTRWGKELSEALEGTNFGILCLTSENQKEAWINFEAGALSKTIEQSYVVPYLIGMKPAELEQPLKQFQAIEANEEDTFKLIETIHIASGDKTRTKNDLDEAFKMWWPKLRENIDKIKNIKGHENKEVAMPTTADLKNSLDKLLTLLESMSQRFTKLETERISTIQSEQLRYLKDLKNQIRLKDVSALGINYLQDSEKMNLYNKILEEAFKLSKKQPDKKENEPE